jgi:uncharacterized protein
MILLLSPAKALDETSALPAHALNAATAAHFVDQAAILIQALKRLKAAQVGELMDLSDKLAELNTTRYAHWQKAHTADNSRPAALMFNGDVYAGLQAGTLTADDWAWAQSHVAILSGLYGVLRPLDLIQPHRLEMGTALMNKRGRNLYSFWGARVAEHLNAQLAHLAEKNRLIKDLRNTSPARRIDDTVHTYEEEITTTKDAFCVSPTIVNLASQEYFKVIDRQILQAPVLDCVFEDWKTDRYKVIGLFAKRARGLLARFAIEQRVHEPQMLQKFTLEGYGFDANASEPLRWVFRRRQP